VMSVCHHQLLLHLLELRPGILNHELAGCGNLKNAWKICF
jgi:hypothetical protein